MAARPVPDAAFADEILGGDEGAAGGFGDVEDVVVLLVRVEHEVNVGPYNLGDVEAEPLDELGDHGRLTNDFFRHKRNCFVPRRGSPLAPFGPHAGGCQERKAAGFVVEGRAVAGGAARNVL